MLISIGAVLFWCSRLVTNIYHDYHTGSNLLHVGAWTDGCVNVLLQLEDQGQELLDVAAYIPLKEKKVRIDQEMHESQMFPL